MIDDNYCIKNIVSFKKENLDTKIVNCKLKLYSKTKHKYLIELKKKQKLEK